MKQGSGGGAGHLHLKSTCSGGEGSAVYDPRLQKMSLAGTHGDRGDRLVTWIISSLFLTEESSASASDKLLCCDIFCCFF
jgi:hypothetical protein